MFRFTIRDLLWLTVVVALSVAWWVDRASCAKERTRFHEMASKLAGERRELAYIQNSLLGQTEEQLREELRLRGIVLFDQPFTFDGGVASDNGRGRSVSNSIVSNTPPDHSAALRAGWESVLRTLPEAESSRREKAASLEVGRFIGLVEGRLGATPPTWWKSIVCETHGRSRRKIDFVFPKRAPTYVSPSGFRLTQGFSLEQVHDGFTLTAGAQTCRIAMEVINAGGKRDNPSIAAAFDGDRCYLALYGIDPRPFELIALNRADGAVVWRSTVPMGDEEQLDYARPQHYVELAVCPHGVIVFGCTHHALYVKGYDQDGNSRVDFDTGLYRVR